MATNYGTWPDAWHQQEALRKFREKKQLQADFADACALIHTLYEYSPFGDSYGMHLKEECEAFLDRHPPGPRGYGA